MMRSQEDAFLRLRDLAGVCERRGSSALYGTARRSCIANADLCAVVIMADANLLARARARALSCANNLSELDALLTALSNERSSGV